MRPRSISFRIKMAVASLALLLILLLTSTVFYGEYRWTLENEVRRMRALEEASSQISEESLRTLLRRSFPFWDLHPSGEPLELPEEVLAVPLATRDGTLLTLRFHPSRMKGEILFQQRHVLVMSVIGLVLAMEVAIFTAYTLARPLHQLARACERIAKRKWHVLPLAPGAPREILLLQKAFNTMVQELQHWQQVQHQVFRMERLAALGQMVAGVSHEIRNPLASMRVHLDLLGESASTENGPSLKILDTELDRLNTLVAQLLTFARPGESVHGPVALEELFTWCGNIASVRLRKKRLRMVRELVSPSPRVLGSMPQLQQLLLNLVLNAIQASPPEGTITLGSSLEEKNCVLSVRDQGPGVPHHIAPRLFDPFVSGHKEGTGLGLSIAARIADLHGGSISWESSAEGTLFRVVLPICREDMTSEKETSS